MDSVLTVYCEQDGDIDDLFDYCEALKSQGLIEDCSFGSASMGEDTITAIVTSELKNAVVTALRAHGFNVVE